MQGVASATDRGAACATDAIVIGIQLEMLISALMPPNAQRMPSAASRAAVIVGCDMLAP